MTTLTGVTLADAGIDGVALKPTEVDVEQAVDLDVETITIDYEGSDAVPDAATLQRLDEDSAVRLTTPVRADGFDPLGDHSATETIPASVDRVLVAGHNAYLTDTEAERAIAPRLRMAVESASDPWVGTEGIERLALAVGGTQYDLLSGSTIRELRSLRTAGFDGEIAVYAPLVMTSDEDEILDALGAYVARRRPVASVLPDGAATDSDAQGRAREILSTAVRDYALVGTAETISDRTAQLKDAGANIVVAYPARGLEPFVE